MSNGGATGHALAFIGALGVLGGAALIVTFMLTHRGSTGLIPYAAIVLAGAVYLRVERVKPFARRMTLSAGSFMVATVILYGFIELFQVRREHSLSLLDHAWRLGLMLLIGSISAAAVAQLTATPENSAA